MRQIKENVFQSVYEGYRNLLAYIAKGYGIPVDEISEIIQETYLSYLDKYTGDTGDKLPVLVTILKNKCIDYHRKKRYEGISIDSEDGEFILDLLVTKTQVDMADEVGKKEFFEKVRQCISKMHKDWQDVILYCCVLQYTSEEAGKILGISGTACRSRLLRAREYLKKELGDEFHQYYG